VGPASCIVVVFVGRLRWGLVSRVQLCHLVLFLV
jgi:hypothetical protein